MTQNDQPYIQLPDGRILNLARIVHMRGDYPLTRADVENSALFKQLGDEEKKRVQQYFVGHSRWPCLVGDEDPQP